MAILGTAVNFGFTGTDGIAEATILTGKILLQSIEYSKAADEEQAKSAVGALVSRNFYNAYEKATLEYEIGTDTLSNARTASTVPAPGTILDITACADLPDLIASNWVVVGEPKISGTASGPKRVTINLEQHAGVTGVAS